MNKTILVVLLIILTLQSCTTMRDLKLLQKNENTVLNEYGLIQHSYEPYRLQIDDRVSVVIETNDPDANEFFSARNINTNSGGGSQGGVGKKGLKIESDGTINLLGIGRLNLLGLTQEQAAEKVQKIIDEIYNPNMAIARVYVESLNFIIIGEVNSPGTKSSDENTLNLIEAIALSGNFTNYANRKNIQLWRQYPEGLKRVDLDLTREDIINSPYFYLHPNDIIMVDPIPEKIIGIGGRSTWQDFTQFISVLAYSLGTFAIIKKL